MGLGYSDSGADYYFICQCREGRQPVWQNWPTFLADRLSPTGCCKACGSYEWDIQTKYGNSINIHKKHEEQ